MISKTYFFDNCQLLRDYTDRRKPFILGCFRSMFHLTTLLKRYCSSEPCR